jgi:hypothetical protein
MAAPPPSPLSSSRAHTPIKTAKSQVIGNKWDTYLDLLQADYSEG